MILLQLLAALLLQAAPPQQSQFASIEGIVLKAGTSEPISKATISLVPLGADPQTTSTGGDGRFVFADVPAGRYRIAVTRSGFLNRLYSQDSGDGSSTNVFNLEAGQDVRGLRLFMTPSAAIFGRVYDSDGNPVPNILVQALKYVYQEDELTLIPATGAQSNDLGEYRLFGLTPGRYYVKSAAFAGAGGLIISGGQRLGTESFEPAAKFAPVYYPGALDLDSARAIDVEAGADFGGIDFTMVPAKMARLRGTVTDGLTGQPRSQLSLSLISRDGSGIARNGAVASDGRFQLEKVSPGSYFLSAGARVGSDITLSGRIPVVVGDADLDNLDILMMPGSDIPGHVIFDSVGQRPADAHPIIVLHAGRSRSEGAEFSDPRTFTIRQVAEGDYDVRLYGLQADEYVKAIRFGSVDASNGLFHVDERSSGSLELVLATTTASISGVVRGGNGENIANLRITLIPDTARRQRPDLYKTTSSDSNGRFRLQNVAPGDYLLFAWQDIEEGIWHDPEFIKQLEGQGTQVHLDEVSSVTVELHLIPAI
jgi:hypothetical protein